MQLLNSPIKINNKCYNSNYFSDNAPSIFFSQSTFLTAIYSFLHEWYNDTNYITVNTSGSTGSPTSIHLKKTVVLHSALKTCEIFKLSQDSTAVLALPVNYVAGKLMLIRAIACGLNLLLIEPDSNPILHINGKIDFIALTPMQLKNGLPLHEKINLCHTILLGGSPIDSSIMEQLNTYDSNIYQSYGMTETATHVALRPINHAETIQPYTAIPGVFFETDNRNCLLIYAKHVSKKAIVTNDIVELIDNTQFYWKGRFDFVINTGGIKVFPEEIEKRISKVINFPFYITGKSDEKLGEKVVIIIQKENYDAYLKHEEKIKILLSKYEIPRDIIKVKKIRFSENGKIIREISL